jgi:hypothetical protein
MVKDLPSGFQLMIFALVLSQSIFHSVVKNFALSPVWLMFTHHHTKQSFVSIVTNNRQVNDRRQTSGRRTDDAASLDPPLTYSLTTTHT